MRLVGFAENVWTDSEEFWYVAGYRFVEISFRIAMFALIWINLGYIAVGIIFGLELIFCIYMVYDAFKMDTPQFYGKTVYVLCDYYKQQNITHND